MVTLAPVSSSQFTRLPLTVSGNSTPVSLTSHVKLAEACRTRMFGPLPNSAHILEIVARLRFEHLIDESARVGVPTSPQIHRQAIFAFMTLAGWILRRRKGGKNEKQSQRCG